jgi:transcriptional regulator with XRE-family HTH domain
MSDTGRGEAIRRRRMALGIRSVRELSARTGVNRGAVSGAEHGEASKGTYERLESWLTEQEENDGRAIVRPVGDPDEGVLEVTIAGNFGVSAVLRGPVSNPDALMQMVDRLVTSMAAQEQQGDEPDVG